MLFLSQMWKLLILILYFEIYIYEMNLPFFFFFFWGHEQNHQITPMIFIINANANWLTAGPNLINFK